MNIPFKFTATTTGEICILWNPWGTAIVSSLDNEAYEAMVDPVSVGVIPPYGQARIVGLTAMTPDGDASFTLGYWDTAPPGGGAAAFCPIFPVTATEVAGGGIVDPTIGEGWEVKFSATKIPALRYDGAAGGIITGQIRVAVPPAATGFGDVTIRHFTTDANGDIVYDANNYPVLSPN